MVMYYRDITWLRLGSRSKVLAFHVSNMLQLFSSVYDASNESDCLMLVLDRSADTKALERILMAAKVPMRES